MAGESGSHSSGDIDQAKSISSGDIPNFVRTFEGGELVDEDEGIELDCIDTPIAAFASAALIPIGVDAAIACCRSSFTFSISFGVSGSVGSAD